MSNVYIVDYINDLNKINNLILKSKKDLNKFEMERILNLVFKINNIEVHILKLEELTEDSIEKYMSEFSYMKKFSIASKTFVYYDDFFHSWKISYFINPNYRILNSINNKKLKLYLIGDLQNEILKDSIKLSYLEYFFKKNFFVDDCSVLIYNMKKNNSCDTDKLYEVFDIYRSDSYFKDNFEIVFLFDKSVDIFSIEKFLGTVYRNSVSNNTHVFLNNGIQEIKPVMYENNNITILNKVIL